LGVFAGLIIDSHQGMSMFNSVVILPMTFLCGTFFSLNNLPDIIKVFLNVLPLTHASQCLRAEALSQPFPWLSFIALVSFGLIFFTGAILTLQKKST
ncbi:MAG: ABC transporter permease, partial [Crenarchaeota archaeon]|nr:ABC transporter permease [Thermoproteota archaeon]